MKKIILIAFTFVFVFYFFACKKEKKEDLVNGTSCSSYNFESHTLSGKIGGTDWSMLQGVFRNSSFDSTKFVADIYNKIYTDSCTYHGSTHFLASIKKPAGHYQLGPNLNVTLFDSITGVNNIAFCGAIEILTVDTVGGTLTGRIDARVDENNYLNGNFTLKMCH